MRRKPTREGIEELVEAIMARKETVTTGRVAFAATAIYLQVNEGIEPFISAGLRYRNFGFREHWVEFVGFNRDDAVRRTLSEQTADHLEAQMMQTGAGPDDLIHTYVPTSAFHPKAYKDGVCLRKEPVQYNVAVRREIELAGYDLKEYGLESLKDFWVDQNPRLRDQERRAIVLVKFIAKWAKPQHQEPLYRKLFSGCPVLRPSWTYPDWHKDALKGKPAANAA